MSIRAEWADCAAGAADVAPERQALATLIAGLRSGVRLGISIEDMDKARRCLVDALAELRDRRARPWAHVAAEDVLFVDDETFDALKAANHGAD